MENQFTGDQIKTGNIIIARFMGWGSSGVLEGEHLYDKSLDWLRPVINKILAIDVKEFEIDRPLQYELERVQESLSNMSINKEVIDFWNEVISAITWYEGAKIKYEAIVALKAETGTSIPEERWGVHETHCCKRHGCKYGEHNNCPVTLGLIKQAYRCETGSDFHEDCFAEEMTAESVFELYEKETDSPTYEGFKNWFLENNFEIRPDETI
jgi:hypothetical protein